MSPEHVKWCWFCPKDCAIEEPHHHSPVTGEVIERGVATGLPDHDPPMERE